ncbi:MAG: hypothetical protein AB4372_03035 [Xenococcus sp. (in: cyanobacteria)]
MRHPFELTSAELKDLELDFGELIPDEEAAKVNGGGDVTTQALGEEGGDVTTQALGEEGGSVTTQALGEEGGATTQALGEEGGGVTTQALGEEGGYFPI